MLFAYPSLASAVVFLDAKRNESGPRSSDSDGLQSPSGMTWKGRCFAAYRTSRVRPLGMAGPSEPKKHRARWVGFLGDVIDHKHVVDTWQLFIRFVQDLREPIQDESVQAW